MVVCQLFGLEIDVSALFAKVIVEQKVGQPHILQGKLGGNRREAGVVKVHFSYLHIYTQLFFHSELILEIVR